MNADSSKDAIALFFDEMSGKRNKLFESNPVLEYEQTVRSKTVLAMLDAQPGDRVLDIGCGNARDIIPLVRAGATVIGIDLSEGMIRQAMLDLAGTNCRAHLQVGDATHLSFATNTFDKIVCSEVIEHIPDADEAMREMYRVLRVGGSLIVSTPNRRSWYGFDRYVLWTTVFRRKWNHPFDNWRTMTALVDLLERHGFIVTSRATVCYLPGFLLTYPLKWKLVQDAIVSIVRKTEWVWSRVVPGNGYLLVVGVEKPSPGEKHRRPSA
jgi:ubiquinone/menaquinone biosynthesis C-methylase UbiE